MDWNCFFIVLFSLHKENDIACLIWLPLRGTERETGLNTICGVSSFQVTNKWINYLSASISSITHMHLPLPLHEKLSSCLSSSAVPWLGLQTSLVARLPPNPAVALPAGAAGAWRGRGHQLGRGMGRVRHPGPGEACQAVGGEEGQASHELRQAQPGAQVMQNARAAAWHWPKALHRAPLNVPPLRSQLFPWACAVNKTHSIISNICCQVK